MSMASDALRTLGGDLFLPALPSVLWLAVHWAFPRIRTTAGLVVLSAATTGLLYRERLPAWILVHAVVALLLHLLLRLPTADGVRWRRARWMMAGLATAFVVGRMAFFARWQGLVFASTFPGGVLDMLVFLKLFTAFWEVGAGKVRALPAGPLWGWLMMPWAGALLRLSEFLPQWPVLTSRSGPPPDPVLTRTRLFDWLGHLGLWAFLAVSGVLLEPLLAGTRIGKLAWTGFVTAPLGFYVIAHLTARTHQMLAAGAGLKIPDNYRRPIGKPNLSEFWANWNITYTNVFRDIFFYQRWGLKRANPYLNSVLLFALVGFWHSPAPYWLVWGLLHGFGFAAFLWWRQRNKPVPGTRPAVHSPSFRVIARAATYVFVCLCWLAPPQILRAAAWAFHLVVPAAGAGS
jgi:MBOAT, membrane-bound O-acyltransferase family